MKFIDEKIIQYCHDTSHHDSDILKELHQYTFKNEELPQMISGNIVGNFLQILIKSLNGKKILEIGTFTGYSSIKMAEGNDDCEIHTCELMEKHVNTANRFINKANLEKNITVHHGPALETLESFHVNYFDFAFIDADKINYLEYYKRAFTLIRKGGIIVLDNMLWSGEVVDPQDDNSKALNKTAKFINEDDRVYNSLFPIRDGLMVCHKK
jgi:caffeoyl-CoA O-methyltransferase